MNKIRTSLSTIAIVALGGLIAFGCSSSSSGSSRNAPLAPAPPGGNGGGGGTGTTFSPSTGTQMVYVSNSLGDDANPGTQALPVKSIAAGIALLRDGQPDWLLLRKGDVWNEGLGQWRLSGSSPSAPMIVWSYGTGARPILRTGAGSALITTGSGGAPASMNNLVFSGLHFQAHTRIPGSPTFTGTSGDSGVRWLRGTTNLLFDDCFIEHYVIGMNFIDLDDLGQSGITIRRCVIVDSYATDPTHAQGMYVEKTNGITIEECIFDHNGWNEVLSGGTQATIFNHNIYIQSTTRNVIVRRNIILRGSSHGIQLRPGGTCQDNIFVRNPIAILFGTSLAVPTGINGTCSGNVITEGNNIGSNARGTGIDLVNVTSANVSSNIIANITTEALNGGNSVAIVTDANTTYSNNIVFNWPGSATFNTPGPFVNDAVSVAAYNALQGGPNTLLGFVNSVRAQSRDAYNTAFTAAAIKTYFTQGFTPN